MLRGVNKSCTTQHAVAQSDYAYEFTKTQLDIAGKALQFSFELATACWLCEPWRPGPSGRTSRTFAGMFWLSCWAEVVLFLESGPAEREREGGGGGGSEIEQNLPLASTSFSVAFPTICMQRRDKRDSNVSRSVSQRRVTNRTVAYRPAVSIRLSWSLGFPTCLILASSLNGRTSGAQWCQERSNFSPCFSLLEQHSLFTKSPSWVSEGPSSLKETQAQKLFLLTIDSWGHHPRALKYFLPKNFPRMPTTGNMNLCQHFIGFASGKNSTSLLYFATTTKTISSMQHSTPDRHPCSSLV